MEVFQSITFSFPSISFFLFFFREYFIKMDSTFESPSFRLKNLFNWNNGYSNYMHSFTTKHMMKFYARFYSNWWYLKHTKKKEEYKLSISINEWYLSAKLVVVKMDEKKSKSERKKEVDELTFSDVLQMTKISTYTHMVYGFLFCFNRHAIEKWKQILFKLAHFHFHPINNYKNPIIAKNK